MRSLLRHGKPDQLALPPARRRHVVRQQWEPGEFRRPQEWGPVLGALGDAEHICNEVFMDQMRVISTPRNRRKGRAWQDEFMCRWVLHLRDHLAWMVGGRAPGESRFGLSS